MVNKLRITVAIFENIVHCSNIEIDSKIKFTLKQLVEPCHVSIRHLLIVITH